MAKPTDPPTSDLTIVVPANTGIKHAGLRTAIAVHNGLVARKQLSFYAADLPPELVQKRLQDHLAILPRTQSAHAEVRITASARKAITATANELLGSLQFLVDGAHPPGSQHRVHFFVTGSTAPTLAERLHAMGAGIRAVGLPGLPSHVTHDSVREQAEQVAAIAVARSDSDRNRSTAVQTRGQHEQYTGEILSRLSSTLRGHFGAKSPELAFYGLHLHKPKGPRGR